MSTFKGHIHIRMSFFVQKILRYCFTIFWLLMKGKKFKCFCYHLNMITKNAQSISKLGIYFFILIVSIRRNMVIQWKYSNRPNHNFWFFDWIKCIKSFVCLKISGAERTLMFCNNLLPLYFFIMCSTYAWIIIQHHKNRTEDT